MASKLNFSRFCHSNRKSREVALVPRTSIIHAGLSTKGATQNQEDFFLLFLWWVQASGIHGASRPIDNTCESGIRGIAKLLGLTPRTVAGYLRELRVRIVKSSAMYTGQLSGTVHVDAWTYRAHKTRNPARRPVLLGMMSNDGLLRVFPISRRCQAEIHPLITHHVAQDTKILTDGSKVFSGLKDQGYPNLTPHRSRQELNDKLRRERTPSLFDFWRIIEDQIHFARGVRTTNYLPRVREAELRWRFRNSPLTDLYRQVIALMVP